MKWFILALICVFCLSAGPAGAVDGHKHRESETPVLGNSVPRAVVAPAKAIFRFPLENAEDIWIWGDAPADACEYAWTVKIPVKNMEYRIAYTKFNGRPGEQEGSLPELIGAGQTDLWRYNPRTQTASVVDNVRVVRAYVEDHCVVLELADKAWIKRLFGHMPKDVEFESNGVNQESSTVRVNVEYAHGYRPSAK